MRVLGTGVAGAPSYSNYYFGGDTQTEADDARTALLAFYTSIRTYFTNAVTFRIDTEVPIIDTVTGNILDVLSVAPGAVVGSGSGSIVPPISQVMMRLKTGVFDTGRQVQGRINLPYTLSTNSTVIGGVNTTQITAIQTAAAALLVAAGAQWGVYSPKAGAFVPISTVTVWEQYASLRSRRD
uniref:Uncharacterized protein n=1 Tax=uncultured prokaryote TaxID=198431 RepID=A0A0H5Q2F2_9ZZZZ|nr:hypothetical protein [uncultured prokaryote]